MKIVVTIPAYNEEKTVGNVIKNIRNVMTKNRYKYEILVVDDGSIDKTAKIAKQLKAIVYSHPHNYGLAETFRTEMKKALERSADIIVHIDADGQYDPKEMPNLIEPIKKKQADIVLGSRFLGTIEEMSWLKRMGNKAFSNVISKITKVKITDGQTGFRAFTKDVAKIDIISTYTYTQEQVIRSVKNKFRIKEIPIHAYKTGKSKLMKSPIHFALNAWINILRVYRDYQPLKFFGSIGALSMIVGFIIGLYILFILFNFGFGAIDEKIPTILLGVLFFVSGLQIILFGFLADKKS